LGTDSLPGALVVSLDFELHWGMRDHTPPTGTAADALRRSRALVPELASLFSERAIRATWATVGFLFASTRAELDPFLPRVRPRYRRSKLDPYAEDIGADEEQDPLHLAGSLVRHLADTAGQEVASHTFSHYYCLEEGQDEEAWRADLAAARAIGDHLGVGLRSLVLPRNQWAPHYAAAVSDSGFTAYRGPQPSWGHRPARPGVVGPVRRAARLVDTYTGLAAPPTTAWADVRGPDGLCNIPASAFLRPFSPTRRWLEPLRRARLVSGLRDAARRARIFHLWWHPHNFAARPQESVDVLRRVLDEFDRLEESDGLRSLAMGDVPALAATSAS
jgi:peptidoglycan/xylan/chitin deacetylase (PgdA/CDA1 family)